MPLHVTSAGMAHEDARFAEMNVSQLRVRISRIRNPQKMFECVCCLARWGGQQTDPSAHRKAQAVYAYANEKLRGMGFGSMGIEIDVNRARESMRGWAPGTVTRSYARRGTNTARLAASRAADAAHRATEEAEARARNTIIRSYRKMCPISMRRVEVYRDRIANSPSGFTQNPDTFFNVLLSADVKPRVIAMAIGVTIDELFIMLKEFGCCTDRQIRDMKDENDNILVKPSVRKIQMRKETE